MDAIFIDQAGNKKNFLYQYDVGQTCIVENFEYSVTPKAQFQIKSLKTSPSASARIVDGDLRISIPDMLLTYGEDIVIYLYIQDATKGNIIETLFVSVIPRKQPAEYQYTSETFTRTINGITISENRNIGEVATWSDGNPSREKRIGYFVKTTYGANGLVIQKSTSINNVFGVTVNNVGFASNCPVEKLDAAGNLIPQCDYICTSGFAEVIDNGRCIVGGRCIPNSDGTAKAADNTIGYEVIARTDTNHIIIFIDVSMNVIDGLQDSINSLNTNLNAHKNDKSNPHETTKAQVGLSEVPNVATNDQTPTYEEATELVQLTSGEKLSIAFGKLSKAVTDFIAHLANKSNPHSVTKAQVGLGNCDNTSDVDKPVSTAQETAINTVQTNLNIHKDDKDNPHAVTKDQVGLGNADNTSDVDKPVSTAQAAEIARVEGLANDAQSDIDTHSSRIDNPHSVTKSQVGLGNCDNTSDTNKPISIATQAALDKKADLVDGLVPLSQLPSQVKEMRVVNTISDRDAITDKFENLRVYVKDATADSTVKSGGADYLYDGSSWIKTSEAESLDLVLSWDNVNDVPTDYTPSAHASTHFTGGSDAITPSDIGADVSGSAAAVQTNLDNHIGDTAIHVTADEKEKWNESDVFIAEYGVTTYSEIQAAIDSGKVVFSKFDTYFGFIIDTDGDTFTFTDGTGYVWDCNTDNSWTFSGEGYAPQHHASTHSSTGTDPITPANIGAAAQSDFETLQNKVNSLSIADFVLTDATTGTQYTIGVDNGVIVLNEVQ